MRITLPASAVEGAPQSRAIATLQRIAPNPFASSTRISWRDPIRRELSLSIYDASGRLVRELLPLGREDQMAWSRWDGTDASGRSVPAGRYYCRLAAAGGSWVEGVVVVR